MDEIIHLSECRNNFIHLQIIKTLSILIININNKVILYYILSNNFINKIIKSINEELIKSDEDFLSHYVNFLKSISLKIDLSNIQLFFMAQTGSFPLLESALSLYNHPDRMIQSVVKNIFLIMLKLNSPQLIEYICSLPTLTYFCFISCRLKDILILLSKENNYEFYKTLQEDIVDELIFIQDILHLKIDKINHILINTLFYYCILPFVLNEKYNAIKLYIKLYFIDALLTIIHDESFINIFFTLLFFPFSTKEINDFIINSPKIPDNYLNEWSEANNNIQLSSKSLSNFVKYNYNKKSYKYISLSNNEIFSEIKKVKSKLKNESNEDVIQKEFEKCIINNLTPEEKKDILDYYNNISLATGINCGINIEDKNNIDKCFINILQKLYVIYFDQSLELKIKLIDNNIKTFLNSLIKIKNHTNNNILALMCLLMRNIIIQNNDKISKLLLKPAKLIGGNYLNENEINNIIKINNDKELIKNILINDEFQEFDDDDEDEDDDFEKILEKRNKKLILNQDDNDKIKGSILINKNDAISYNNYDKNYFNYYEKKIDNIIVEDKFNNKTYYYDINLIENLIIIMDLQNNIKPIFFNCIVEIILTLISKNKDNNTIIFVSPRIKTKVQKIYQDFKEYIVNSYKTNKLFYDSGYNRFQKQYKIFLSLSNIDYDDLIKHGYIILNKNLLNFKSNIYQKYEDVLINNKQFVKNEEEILNNNIINFFIIHDFYYIISTENNKNIFQSNDLFVNKYPLLFEELNLNEQYLLCDLNPRIKYFPCKCKITSKNKSLNNYFDCTILLYENQIYIGNSSSNPNYTRVINKYQISDCSIKYSKNVKNCIELFFLENKNDYITIELIFSDTELLNQKIYLIKEEIDSSMVKEKKKLEEFLKNLK